MILIGDREAVAAWVCSKIRDQEPFLTGYEALGAIDGEGRIIGGFVYAEHREFSNGGSVAIIAAGQGNWLTRANLRVFFEYPFLQLGCHRVCASIAKANRKSRNIAERIGFKPEGLMRHGLGLGKHAVLYSMLKDECIWLEAKKNEQR